jgi:hypothetical protein
VVTGTVSGVGTAPALGGPAQGNQHRPGTPGTREGEGRGRREGSRAGCGVGRG